MKKLILANSISALILAAGASAASAWTGDFEVGYSSSSGNTENTSLNAKVDIDHANGSWRHNIFGDIYYAESDGDKTAERYALGYKPRYFLTDVDYLFGLLRYDTDEFAFIDNRYTEVAGYGRLFFNDDKYYWDGEIGVGARQTDYHDDPSTIDLKEEEVIGFLGTKFSIRISPNARFLETLRAEIGEDNTYIESITGLQLAIAGNLSSSITYTVRHNTDIEGVLGEKTDTITGVNLVYSF
jgi:putative salt-induced outer membrane protein